jgi:uncharacterized protein (TIGR01777 family)
MNPRIILAGGSGFLGQALASHFQEHGFDVVILTRSPGQHARAGRQMLWDARTPGPWTLELEGAAAVVNLTGKSVNCRYTERNRQEILGSRLNSTRVIGRAIGLCTQPPAVWLNASTATVYRHTFDNAWDERGPTESSAEAKDRFSVEVAWAWEQALNESSTPRTRKIALRMAMVLGLAKNSVFPMLRRLASLGLGGKMGSGRQFVSWIHETDFCRAVKWLISHDSLNGSVNITAPSPVPNAEMMRHLRRVCHVPFGLPAANWMLQVGAFLLRTETELILKSRRVIPGRLLESGFDFQVPTIREAFEKLNNQSALEYCA